MKKEIQDYIVELLNIFDIKIPAKANHNIQLTSYGNLCLWLNINDKWQSVIFDEPEELAPKDLANSIIEDLKEAGYNI